MNKILIVIFAIFFIFIIQSSPVLATSSFIDGLKNSGSEMGYQDPKAGMSYMSFFAKLVQSAQTPIFFGVSGMISFAYAGYKWMMASGDEQQVQLAKTIILNTTIAMIIAFSAYTIVRLIIYLWVDPIFAL